MKVDITSAADVDLEAIPDYIARDNPTRALSFVLELYERRLDISGVPEAWPEHIASVAGSTAAI
jgi:plasmid stabilization system protein ParE